MKITILDSIECEVSKADGMRLIPCLSFDAVFWVQGPYRKTKKQYKKQVFSFKGKAVWRFYTGLLPHVTQWCAEQGITVEVVGEEIRIKPQAKPFLKGITFREDQLKLIEAACAKQRGILVAPTGSGKTLVFLGIMSCYPKLNILVLSHTTTIISQTMDELRKFGFSDVQQFGGGNQISKPSKRIVVSTIQSFSKLPKEDYIDYFDAVVVDECHSVAKQSSMYSKVLGNLLAPLRFGLSATPLKNDEAQLVYEGLIGPIIGRLTIKEASELEILAEPRLRLVKAKYPQELTTIWKYQDTYEKIRENGKLVNGKRLKVGAYTAGITENTARHKQIANLVNEFSTKNQTVLVFVTQIEHGIQLQQEIENLLKYKIPFVQGNTLQTERDKIKKQLLKKEIKACIATVSWELGLNIPTLSALILAGSGRSEKPLLQKI